MRMEKREYGDGGGDGMEMNGIFRNGTYTRYNKNDKRIG